MRRRARAPVPGRDYLQRQLRNRLGSGLIRATKIDPNMSDHELTVDYMMETIWIVSDPDERSQRIRPLCDEAGGFGYRPGIAREPDCLRFIGRKLRPSVSDLNGGIDRRAGRDNGGTHSESISERER